jgi:transglutaminase-like putative cysteine protease
VECSVTHVTRFQYHAQVHESVMELRLAPRKSGQEAQAFELETNPAATLFEYVDPFGNHVHHFDIVEPHDELTIEARMRVRTFPERVLPENLEPSAWDTLARLRAEGELWDFFEPSPHVALSPSVHAFANAHRLARTADPLTCIRGIVSSVHQALAYAPESTTVDTPLETVLETRRGVCQDFAHVCLALARANGIPCRYVSGYLVPKGEQSDTRPLASHAWIEVWLPTLDWTAFDPTHDLVAGERHISIAVGRDYGDAAPTRGVFRGGPAGTLAVSVRIEPVGGVASTAREWWRAPIVSAAPVPASAQRDQ